MESACGGSTGSIGTETCEEEMLRKEEMHDMGGGQGSVRVPEM